MRAMLIILTALAALSGCVSANANMSEQDAALAGLATAQAARLRECPPERTQASARSEGFGATDGVTVENIAVTALVSDPTRVLRLRRIVVQPGGVIAWHDHAAVQGMALVTTGEMVELRNTCLDPIVYRPGDIAIEDAETAHSWRNESGEIAVVLVAHVVAR